MYLRFSFQTMQAFLQGATSLKKSGPTGEPGTSGKKSKKERSLPWVEK